MFRRISFAGEQSAFYQKRLAKLEKEKIVIGVTGMPGSGKSTLVRIARGLGYAVAVMGDFIREEACRRQLQPTAENIGWLMFQLRKDKGEAVVAEMTIEAIKAMESPVVVVDGVRSLKEVETFKAAFGKFRLIAVQSPAKFRFERVRRRLRRDDPKAWRKFEERDYREVFVGVQDAVSKADVTVENTGSLESFELNVKKILEDMVNELSADCNC